MREQSAALDGCLATVEHFDLIIVGTGSGNSIPEELADRRIALVERDVFGGTCLNRGCIPTKMFVYVADQIVHAREAGRFGIDATVHGVDWAGTVERVFGRIDPIAAGGARYRVDDCPNITVFAGTGAFVDDKVLAVQDAEGNEQARLGSDTFILAAGARPFVPDVPGLAEAGFHTSDTIMRLPEVPRRLAILGGGYIATEMAHVFDAFGAEVTILNRGPRLLRAEDDAISARYTQLAADRYDLRLGVTVDRVAVAADGTKVIHHTVDRGSGPEALELACDEILVATGRIPNSDHLAVERTGVATDAAGRVVVDRRGETSVPGIYAFGDLSNHHQLKHVANAEAKIVFHNVAHPEDRRRMDYTAVPHAVFGSPQVASVGMTEAQVMREGIPFVTATKDYGATAYGWAMEDTTSFVKLIAHATTRELLGAHLLGPQSATLIQPLIQGMKAGQTVDSMARDQMWIHPALTEVVENALLDL